MEMAEDGILRKLNPRRASVDSTLLHAAAGSSHRVDRNRSFSAVTEQKSKQHLDVLPEPVILRRSSDSRRLQSPMLDHLRHRKSLDVVQVGPQGLSNPERTRDALFRE